MYETVTLEITDEIARLTLDRPGQHNTATPQLFRDLVDSVGEIEASDARAVIFTGAGEEAFCAGMNIPAFEEADIDSLRDAYHYARDPFLRSYAVIEELPVPVIAAVNGYAFGFGMGITLACDIVIASQQAEFRLPESEWGLVPVDSLTRGVDIAGRRVIAYHALTGEPLGPEEAQTVGLVNEVHPHERLSDRAEALASSVTEKAPLAQEYIKRILNIDAGHDYEWSAEVLGAAFLSEEFQEGLDAFKNDRKPDYDTLSRS